VSPSTGVNSSSYRNTFNSTERPKIGVYSIRSESRNGVATIPTPTSLLMLAGRNQERSVSLNRDRKQAIKKKASIVGGMAQYSIGTKQSSTIDTSSRQGRLCDRHQHMAAKRYSNIDEPPI